MFLLLAVLLLFWSCCPQLQLLITPFYPTALSNTLTAPYSLFAFFFSPSLPLHLCGNAGIAIYKGEMKEKVIVLRELLRVIIYTRELSKQAIEGHVSTTIPLATMRRRSIFHPEQ
jgi:hypothetical protein